MIDQSRKEERISTIIISSSLFNHSGNSTHPTNTMLIIIQKKA